VVDHLFVEEQLLVFQELLLEVHLLEDHLLNLTFHQQQNPFLVKMAHHPFLQMDLHPELE